LRIQFCGVRGSLPASGVDFFRYGGHTSCLALAHDGAPTPTLMLDGGTGLVAAAGLLGGEPFTGTILLSHLHWDHTYGLPFFAAGDRPDARVRVMLPEQEDGRDATAALAGLMSPPYFPVGPMELRGEWTVTSIAPGERDVEGFDVVAREIPHKGGRTLGYRISDGHSTLAYLPDHNPTALGPGEDGFGVYHAAALELADHADVLVHDSQLFPAELASEGYFGHALGDYAVELGRRAGVRAVVLFHHRHDRTDDALDELARRLGGEGSASAPSGSGSGFQEGSPVVSVAAEGTVLEL
jgi:phosphoribosyl 1,2-cyclic phosphodiesterase